MTSKSISLPDSLWQLVSQRVKEGEYRDESDYFAQLARTETALNRRKLEAWETFTVEMEKGINSPPIEGSETDMRKRIVERSKARKASLIQSPSSNGS